MTTVIVRRTAQATPPRVWSVATDIDHWPETMSGIDAVEVIAGSGFDVGTRWRETRTMSGKQVTEEMAVTAMEDGRSYTVESGGRGAHYVSVFSFLPAGNGATEIELSFTLQPTSAVARMLDRLAAPLTRRTLVNGLQGDLDDVAAVAEGGAGLGA
ncbi:MAG TPA: SRPBCC family protein [Nocardioidaceae bacterium]|nr:SRPBCC family protein [Nocardioidaceae bacterium]